MRKILFSIALVVLIFSSNQTFAQGQLDDYNRADELREKYRDKSLFDKLNINWIDSSNQLWYSVNTDKGTEYFIVDAEKSARKSALNQEKLASNLSKLNEAPRRKQRGILKQRELLFLV